VAALAEEARQHSPNEILIRIPVDLRRHRPGLVSSANLTGMVDVHLSKGWDADDPAVAFQEALKAEISNKRYLNGNPAVELVLRNMPLKVFSQRLALKVKQTLADARFWETAIITNLGFVDCDELHGGGFFTDTIYCVPPGTPWIPLFVGLFGSKRGLEISATMAVGLATNNRLKRMLDNVAQRLS